MLLCGEVITPRERDDGASGGRKCTEVISRLAVKRETVRGDQQVENVCKVSNVSQEALC